MKRILGIICVTLALAACTDRRPSGWPYTFVSRFMPADPAELALRQPLRFTDISGYAVLMYMRGSGSESAKDLCSTTKAGRDVPHAVVDLSGKTVAGLTLLVYAYCTPSRVGAFNRPEGDGVPKVIRRAEDIEAMAGEFLRAGLPANRLFLTGQSAGGWASLLVARGGDVPVAGVIGFAPAFAGVKILRPEEWQTERDRQLAYIAEAPRIDALLFHFEGDRFEPPEDTAIFASIPGVERVILPGDAINGIGCNNDYPHATLFQDCFRHTQQARILAFIERRLRESGGAAE